MATPPPDATSRLVSFGNRRARRAALAAKPRAERVQPARPKARRWPVRLLVQLGAGGIVGFALVAAGQGVFAQPQGIGVGDGPALITPGGLEGLPGSALRPFRPAQPRREAAPAAEDANDRPVTFTAESVEYDRDRGVVTARGRVEAWQGERVVRADEFTYDRNTRVARLRGNVQILEATGEVAFADEAELGEGFRDGVLENIRGILAQNARIAANGARRTGGAITDLARIVYSACNLCAEDPTRPPLWQLRARVATQDRERQRISYRDAVVEVGGVPVLYTPFLSHPDPASPRASGFLFPTIGQTRFLGAFVQTPYFWAIDEQQDLTITPLFSYRELPNLAGEYRRVFNNGELQIQGSIGYYQDPTIEPTRTVAGHVFSRGRFALDENWRVGFDINRASSELYLRTFRQEFRRVLTSQVYAEGFWGTEGYARIDARAYQGLRRTDDLTRTPFVLPNLYYEWAPRQRVLGGNLTLDVGALGLSRSAGSWSQRQAVRIGWERADVDPLGGLWTFRMQSDLRNYFAGGQERPPSFLPDANGQRGDANVRFAVDWRMPFIRDAGEWGTQVVEPRVQLVTGPNTGRQTRFPNDDSVDFEFNEGNLFQLNRFTGRDRQEGGTRVDMALRGQWNLPNGLRIEGVAGRSYRLTEEAIFPANSGLNRRWSDWVARATVSPTPWLDLTARTRLDGETGQHRASDVVAGAQLGRVGPLENVVLTGGYLYSPALPFFNPPTARNEVSAGASAAIRTAGGGLWRAGATFRYDIQRDRPVLITGSVGYEDECFLVEGRFMRRFAVDPTTNTEYLGNTIFLLRIGLKTVGDYSFRAI
jgi:LPS-assembly protein